MLLSIAITALIGFSVSLYAYIVEKKIKENPLYKPACDLSARISCSKPITSSYGKIFFISNSLAGMCFYAVIAILALIGATKLLLLATLGGVLFSCVLAYILYVKIQSLCIVCTTLYVVNGILLYLSIQAQ